MTLVSMYINPLSLHQITYKNPLTFDSKYIRLFWTYPQKNYFWTQMKNLNNTESV